MITTKKLLLSLFVAAVSIVLAAAATAAIVQAPFFGLSDYFNEKFFKPKQYSVTVHFTDPVQFAYDVTAVNIDSGGTKLAAAPSSQDIIMLNALDIAAGNKILEFRQDASIPPGAEIGYQITSDRSYWYYHDGNEWISAANCVKTCVNTAEEMHQHLPSFPITSDGVQLKVYLKARNETPVLRSATMVVQGREKERLAFDYKPSEEMAILEALAATEEVNSCGYPMPSENVLRSIRPVPGTIVADGDTLKAWYNHDNAMLLGVRKVVVNSSGGQTETDYSVSSLNANPDYVADPDTGAGGLTGDQAGIDSNGWPIYPSLFVTDITSNPSDTSGDWQNGGTPITPHDVFGTWRSAVKYVDNTQAPADVSIVPDSNPVGNNWNLGSGDTPPAGLPNNGWSSEARWDIDDLGLTPGHSYRLQVLMHAGEDSGTPPGGECDPEEELVANGSFEQPIVTDPHNWDVFLDGHPVLNWRVEWQSTQTTYQNHVRPETAKLELHRGVNGWPAQEGLQYAELDADWDGPGGSLNGEPASVRIYQNIPTKPGYKYKIRFSFSPRPNQGANDNKLEVSWDGNVVDTITEAGGSWVSWTDYEYEVVATENVTRLQFADLGNPNSYGTFLDNVSVRCQQPQCQTNAHLKIDFKRVQNKGNGNATANSYVGASATAFPDGALIPLTDGSGNFIVDGGMDTNVPGLAVERGINFVRVYLKGDQSAQDLEIVDADMTFVDAKITDFANGSPHPLEKQGDGIYADQAGQDEVFPNIGTTQSNAYTRVNTDSDNWYLYYECLPTAQCGDGIMNSGEECDDGNNEDGDGCSAVCEIEETCRTINFLNPLENVDGDITGWSTNDGTVNLGAASWPLLNGAALLQGFKNGQPYNLSHRGTKGVGVYGQETDEVDSNGSPEKAAIIFQTPVCIANLEVQSFYPNEGNGAEQGDIDLYYNGGLVHNYHMLGESAQGNWSANVPLTMADKIEYYVQPDLSYSSKSEFAISKVVICPCGGPGDDDDDANDDDDEPVCGDGNLDQGEQCDDGNNENGDGCSAECAIEEDIITIEAYKVVCLQESDLPNWGFGGPDINAQTAIDYVANSNGNCRLEPNWQFEWNHDKKTLNGDYTGPAPSGENWNSFDSPSTAGGPAKVILGSAEINGDTEIWFREVLQTGFVPFTAPPKGLQEDNVTAEFYCHTDVVNYDNLEWIRNMQTGNTYYCVAFNSPIEAPNCGDGNVDPGEQCDDGNNENGDGCDSQCMLEGDDDDANDDDDDTGGACDNLVAYWHLDETSQGSYDDAYNGYNGSCTGGVCPVSAFGQISYAQIFDGADDYITAGNISQLNNASKFTIEGWFKDADTDGYNRLFHKGDDLNNDVSAATYNGDLYFEVGNTANSFGKWSAYKETIPSGTWFHAVFVYDGTKTGNTERMKLYVNGVERTLDFSGNIPAATADLSAFNFHISKNDSHPWNGGIDELAVYQYAFTSSDVSTHYADNDGYCGYTGGGDDDDANDDDANDDDDDTNDDDANDDDANDDDEPNTCDAYCQNLGYDSGSCNNSCNGGTYESGGDQYCSLSPATYGCMSGRCADDDDDEEEEICINADPKNVTFYIPLKSSTSGNYPSRGTSSDSVTLTTGSPISSGYLNIGFDFNSIPAGFYDAKLYIDFTDLDLHGDTNKDGSKESTLYETFTLKDSSDNVITTLNTSHSQDDNFNWQYNLSDGLFSGSSLSLKTTLTAQTTLTKGSSYTLSNSSEQIKNVKICGKVSSGDDDDDANDDDDDTSKCCCYSQQGDDDDDANDDANDDDDEEQVPRCNGLEATIWVNSQNKIVGGSKDGDTYRGSLNGGSGNDVIVGTNGDDNINGNNGNDVICGLDGDDKLYGNNGDDLIYGGAGNDDIKGNDQDDILYGEDGNDEIDGGNDDDEIYGGTGNDEIKGENGSDVVCGETGNDDIDGGQGNDKIDADGGNDKIDGKQNNDICINGEDLDNCEDTSTQIPQCSGVQTAVITREPAPFFSHYVTLAVAPPGDGDVGMGCTTITIPPDNPQPPVAVPDYATTTVNTPITIDVPDNDTDPNNDIDEGSVTIDTDPLHGTITSINPVTGAVTYDPDSGYIGNDIFVYQICDMTALCSTTTVMVAIVSDQEPVPPVANDDSAATPFNTSVAIDILNNDYDPDGFLVTSTIKITVWPAHGTTTSINPATGAVMYQPDLDYSGTDTFEYEVCDNDGLCDTATVTITIEDYEEPPEDGPDAVDDYAMTERNTEVVIDIIANDTDPENSLVTSSIVIVDNPTWGTVTNISPTSGLATYMPGPAFTGLDTFKYKICNLDGKCDTALVTITVKCSNCGGGGGEFDPPVAEDDTYDTSPGTPITFDVTTNDYDPDGVLEYGSYTILANPSHGTLSDINATSTTYTPDPGFIGSDIFQYRICDNDSLCDTAFVTIHVRTGGGGDDDDADDDDGGGQLLPPIANDDNVTTPQNTPITIDVLTNDSDPDGVLVPNSVREITLPANGSITFIDSANGRITYEPGSDFTGTDSFVYQVCDNDGFCDIATVNINVVSSVPLVVPPAALAAPAPILPPTGAIGINAVHCNITIAQSPIVTITGVTTPTVPAGTLVQYSMNGGASWNLVPTVGNVGGTGDGTFSYDLADLGSGDYSTIVRSVLPDGTVLFSAFCPFSVAGDLVIGANQFVFQSRQSPLTEFGSVQFVLNQPQTIYLEAEASTVNLVNIQTGDIYPLTLDPDLHLWTADLIFTQPGWFRLRVDVSNGIATYSREINPINVVQPEAIIDPEGNPVSGAAVTIYRQEGDAFRVWNGAQFGVANPTLTDDLGHFTITLPRGSYYVTIAKEGFATAQSLIVDIDDFNTISASVVMQPVKGTLGQITDTLFQSNVAENFPLIVHPLIPVSLYADNEALPDFNFTREDGTIEALSDITDDDLPTLVFVFGPWNTEAQEQMDIFEGVANQFAGQASLLTLTSLLPQEYSAQYKDRGEYLIEANVPENSFFDTWRITSLPTLFIMRPDGTLYQAIIGSYSADQLTAIINQAIADMQ